MVCQIFWYQSWSKLSGFQTPFLIERKPDKLEIPINAYQKESKGLPEVYVERRQLSMMDMFC